VECDKHDSNLLMEMNAAPIGVNKFSFTISSQFPLIDDTFDDEEEISFVLSMCASLLKYGLPGPYVEKKAIWVSGISHSVVCSFIFFPFAQNCFA